MAKLLLSKIGKTWQYKFEAAKINGKRQRINKSGFKTKSEASRAGTLAMSEYYQSGLNFTPVEMSFSDFLDDWIESYCKMNLKITTIANYRKRIEKHIKPALGIYKLQYISPSILQKFINDKAKENYSRNTLSVLKGVLSGSLNYAVSQGLIRCNPMSNVRLPSLRSESIHSRTSPHVYISPDKIKEIFERFPEGASTHIPMMTGYKGGLRIGEAFALIWDDIHFQTNTICVNRQIQWNAADKAWYLSTPKYNSYREIDMDPDYMKLLWAENEKQKRAREYYGERYVVYYEDKDRKLNTQCNGKEICLVCIREDGTYITPRTMQHTSSIIQHQIGFSDFTYHSFRHTHATLLAENRAPLNYLRQRLGHQNLQVTMKYYMHLTEIMSDEGKKILNGLYKNG